MNEYEMLYLIRQNNEEAEKLLLRIFQRKIYHTIHRIKDKRNYRSTTSDEDDELTQYCNQALLNAAESYQDYGGASFSHYATCCIETAVRTYIRHKRSNTNQGLSKALPLDALISDKEGLYYLDVVENRNPAFEPQSTIAKMERDRLRQHLKEKLTESEYRVYEMRILGYKNREIAEELNVTIRRICYIQGKIKKLLARYID